MSMNSCIRYICFYDKNSVFLKICLNEKFVEVLDSSPERLSDFLHYEKATKVPEQMRKKTGRDDENSKLCVSSTERRRIIK